jgi:lipopolysaccharide export LptBFGC system permease protein LptF
MRDCEVYDMNPNGVRGCFPEKTEEVALPPIIGPVDPKPRDLSWQQIFKHRRETLEIEDNLREQIKEAEEHPELLKGTHPDVAKHRDNLEQKLFFTHQKVYQFDAELQMRPSLALGCFFFVVIGCPVGIWFSRSDFLSAFITCFLPIVFLYYPLMLCGTNLAKEGRFIPVLGVWGADILMAVIGLALFRRLLKN